MKCKYGKLKHRVGRRVCKLKRSAKRKSGAASRRARIARQEAAMWKAHSSMGRHKRRR